MSYNRIKEKRRWFIFYGTKQWTAAYFSTEGKARAFIRFMGAKEHKFEYKKRAVTKQMVGARI